MSSITAARARRRKGKVEERAPARARRRRPNLHFIRPTLRIDHRDHDVDFVTRVDVGVRGDVGVGHGVDGVAIVIVIVVVDVVGHVRRQREDVENDDEKRHLRDVDDGCVGGGRAVEALGGPVATATNRHVKYRRGLARPPGRSLGPT